MRNLVVDGDSEVITLTVGRGANEISAVTACATAIAISVDEGGAGPGAGPGAPAAAAAGAAAATKPVAESVTSVPHVDT